MLTRSDRMVAWSNSPGIQRTGFIVGGQSETEVEVEDAVSGEIRLLNAVSLAVVDHTGYPVPRRPYVPFRR